VFIAPIVHCECTLHILEAMYENCLAIGDSYVKHLQLFHERIFPGDYFFVHGSPVEVWGQSGAGVEHIGSCLSDVPFAYRHYSAVVLSCGINDVCRRDCTVDQLTMA
jgi:hypothetical protein